MSRFCFVFLHQPWRSAVELYTQVRESIDYYAPEADWYILPETLIGGFGIDPELLAEGIGGQTYNYMRLIASQIKSNIVAGLTIQDELRNLYFRVFSFSERPELELQEFEDIMDDKYQFYRKRSGYFKCGDILIFVCADLRFPASYYTNDQFSSLIYVGNSPAASYDTWSDLLKIKSMEHRCPVIGCLRINDSGVERDILEYNSPQSSEILEVADYKCFVDL